MITEQMALAFGDHYDWRKLIARHWTELLETIRHAANRIGRKQVAHDLDLKKTVLDNLLAGRERHHLKARLLPYFILRDIAVVQHVCRIAGGRFERERTLTDKEKLAALEAAVSSLGPAAPSIFAAAWGEG